MNGGSVAAIARAISTATLAVRRQRSPEAACVTGLMAHSSHLFRRRRCLRATAIGDRQRVCSDGKHVVLQALQFFGRKTEACLGR